MEMRSPPSPRVTAPLMVNSPATLKFPSRVEVPETFKVVTLAVSVINLLEDKSVTEKIVAPPKLVTGLEGMTVTGEMEEEPEGPLGPAGPCGPGGPWMP